MLFVLGGCPAPEQPATQPREAPPDERTHDSTTQNDQAAVDDQQLEQRVNQRITQDQVLSPIAQERLNVQVNDGVVTLRGQVESLDESQRIEELVLQVQGVLDVQNHLEVMDQQDDTLHDDSTFDGDSF